MNLKKGNVSESLKMKQILEQQPCQPPIASSPREQTPWFYAFWKFSRPHTIIGTTLSVWGLYWIALATSSLNFSSGQLSQLFGTWIACLCGNIYIVGLNQLEDIEIDQINKPHLPLAAGEFSRRQAQFIVGLTGIAALGIAGALGPFLLEMVGISLAIGTAYSLPPIRLKRFPLWAALCIFTVRGAVVNLGLFLHFNWVLEKKEVTGGNGSATLEELADLIRHPLDWLSIPSEVWALTLFILVFTFAIAIFKDIPDIEGDARYQITTFSIRLGAPAVFNLARWVLTFCYGGMVLTGILWLSSINSAFLGISHLTALSFIWWRSQKVDLQNRAAIAQFYQFIWKLFFLEYLIFPAACLLG